MSKKSIDVNPSQGIACGITLIAKTGGSKVIQPDTKPNIDNSQTLDNSHVNEKTSHTGKD